MFHVLIIALSWRIKWYGLESVKTFTVPKWCDFSVLAFTGTVTYSADLISQICFEWNRATRNNRSKFPFNKKDLLVLHLELIIKVLKQCGWSPFNKMLPPVFNYQTCDFIQRKDYCGTQRSPIQVHTHKKTNIEKNHVFFLRKLI